jgi:hypothetical protein
MISYNHLKPIVKKISKYNTIAVIYQIIAEIRESDVHGLMIESGEPNYPSWQLASLLEWLFLYCDENNKANKKSRYYSSNCVN